MITRESKRTLAWTPFLAPIQIQIHWKVGLAKTIRIRHAHIRAAANVCRLDMKLIFRKGQTARRGLHAPTRGMPIPRAELGLI